MDAKPYWLLDCRSNTYSQTGEDGVIARILSLLPDTDGWCVDCGALDGIHLSNVRKLILERNYRAVLIEGDSGRFRALADNYADNGRVHTVNAIVGFTADDGLDRILSSSGIPHGFDFLSIDIDGNDYHVWAAVDEFRPKVVCVEFNPTVPTEVHFVQPADPRLKHGCSLLALDELARAKGYELVCVLPWNAFFVDAKYFPTFGIASNTPRDLRRDQSWVTWMFSGYDGTVHLAGSKTMPWHGVSIDERNTQILPRILRAFPGDYTKFQKRLFRIMKRVGLLRAAS